MLAKFPCKICNNPVAKNHKAVEFDNCGLWVRIKCNKINTQTYTCLQKESCVWYCISCSSKMLPFSNLNEEDFHKTIHGKKVPFLTITKNRNENEQMLIEKLNDAIDKEDLENSSLYFHVDELNNNFSENEFNGKNFLHMNTSSICHNFDDLQTLLARINVTFNVIGITETRLNKSSIRNTDIDLSGYSFEHTPTEANCGGALLCIDNNINYIV